MKVTGRSLPSSNAVKGSKQEFLATQSGDEVVLSARILELRTLVASGRYSVDTDRLAREIFRRAQPRRARKAGH
ncbi:MAG: flagellar biosynthesis anti-sigma factor FlgM [Deltaproteobacteria bacterium]|nr:flagellar biosynthesis anti-sigma factor FlgM [Deltaproteobacteria bacterium]